MLNAVLLDRQDGRTATSIAQLDESNLPAGDVTIDVEYSTINYKDALAITGRGPVVREWPMVPGIDGVGIVSQAALTSGFKVGDRVLLNGWGVGEVHWGCLAQRVRLKSDWLIELPLDMDSWTAMALGTAGYTAMLCVQSLERHGITPDQGDILVTGATGGVGSVAVHLLSKRGYKVIASTGRANEAAYLQRLGATAVIDRAELSSAGKPLSKERWAGVVDSVGSHTLANACAGTQYGGVVTACGLAQGMDFPATVAPFILRGITLAGIDSVMAPRKVRYSAWKALTAEIDRNLVREIAREIRLDEVEDTANALLDGRVRGRVVVDVNR